MSHRCLVTGGAGFIGSHLVDRLLADGHDVAVIDNFSTGNANNLAHLAGHKKLAVHEADVADLEAICPLLEGIDWVFHLAALADIVPSIERPLVYHHSNVDGTASVAEASRRAKVGRLIYAASSSCYGIPDVYPTPETAEPRPHYPYALTKHLGEQIVLHWSQVYRVPAISLRLFNVYGPRARTTGSYGAVFGVFLAQKLAGKPFTVVGDGTQTRDFTYVTDVADAFARAAECELSGEVFNIGSSAPASVNRLVELLGGDRTHIPKRPGEPDCTFADARKASRMLGWQPQVPLEEGVRRMLQGIEAWRTAPVWEPQTIAAATKDWFTYLSREAA
jgi:UDP-glucose 4-epimerase